MKNVWEIFDDLIRNKRISMEIAPDSSESPKGWGKSRGSDGRRGKTAGSNGRTGGWYSALSTGR